MRDTLYWLALQQKYWIIPAEKISKAIKELGSLSSFWEAEEEYLVNLGLSERQRKSFNEYRNSVNIASFEKQLDELYQKNIGLMKYTDVEYPTLLRNIGSNAPRALFYKKKMINLDNCVAIGGTRNCSEEGQRLAYETSKKLAEKGYTIVSGLASGIDTEAHKAALETKSNTVAVLAWIDPVFPPENIELARKIESQGVILSECYKKPKSNCKWRFVERNRIISGMSKCVVATETSDKGGTVRLVEGALRQRKKVFVYEQDKSNERALKGYKLLLSKGATSIKSYREILGFLSGQVLSTNSLRTSKKPETPFYRTLEEFS